LRQGAGIGDLPSEPPGSVAQRLSSSERKLAMGAKSSQAKYAISL
jgi:hypothetical protein